LSVIDEYSRVVDYRDLTPEVVVNIARFFGLPVSSSTEFRIAAAFAVHGKHPNRPFTSDADAKQRDATQAIREAVDTWVRGPYEALRRIASRDLFRLGRPSDKAAAEGVLS